jgi:hypothetical protein
VEIGIRQTPLEGPDIELYLEEAPGGVAVRGRDRDGINWYILTIYPAGINRALSVGHNLGFPLDEQGRIVLNE